ncbi:hypothetical protein BYT27DRAFT_6493655 [Phlegmacium glaucopus]|nr:hypothetical protein BYT27DRAFT_6493655 [Phlegmacium glaucopus]
MSSRNAYTAITPEYADFPIPHTSIPSGLNPSSSKPHAEDHEEYIPSDEGEGTVPSRIHSWLASANGVRQRNTGLLLVIASQVFLSLMNVAVKMLNSIDPPVTTLELVAVRMIITYICCITYMVARKVPDPILGPKEVRLLLVFRGFIGFFGLFGIYYSLQYLSLSDATVLTFLAPMVTAMAGALFLGETFARREAFAGLVSLIGVVLIARPTAIFGAASHPHSPITVLPEAVTGGQVIVPTSATEKGTQSERLIAVGVALIGVLGQSGAYTTIRAIGTRAHAMHTTTFFALMCIVVSILGIIATKAPIIIPTRIDWLALLLMIGMFGFIAQALLTMGLQRETAGRAAMAIYTQIVFAAILEKIVFHAVPTALSIIGTLLIMISACYVALTKEQDPPAPKSIQIRRLSQDIELEEGLLSSLREDGDKLGRNVHSGDEIN